MIGGGFRGNFPEKGKGGEYKPRVGIVRNPQAIHNHPAELGPRVLHNPSKEQVDKKAPKGPAYEPQVSWNGVVHGYSGYAKANREIIKRLATFVKVGLGRQIQWNAAEKDPAIYGLYMYYNNIPVSNGAPSVTFNPPQVEIGSRYRIIYTMMETEAVHPDMIRVMNENYRECWTPTYWNAQTFRRGGLSIPVHVMPLGVDPSIYAPSVSPKMPEAILVTTSDAGRVEVPKGFTFISVGQPTFRKGFDLLLQAFEEAFYGDNTVALVLGTTDYSVGNLLPRKDLTTRVYALTGRYTERELASIYKACNVYVTASRGEGWNLPLCLVEGTEVDTLNGPVPIERIAPGMVVTDHNGEDALVEGVTHREHDGEVVSIKRYGDTKEIVSDPLHPHLILKRPFKQFGPSLRAIQRGDVRPQWVKAGEVSKGDFMCVPKLPSLKKDLPAPVVIKSIVESVVENGSGEVSLPRSYHTSGEVTLKTVADKLGVGFKHVSKILNGRGSNGPGVDGRRSRYSQEHVDRVMAVAEEVGYKTPQPVTVRNVISMTEDVGFFFGLYISEGSALDKRNGINITLHAKETWAADLCVRVLRNEFGVSAAQRFFENKIIINASCRILGEAFESLFGVGARNKRIPNEWKRLRWVRHVVSGIFYGDGCYHRQGAMRYSFSTSSIRLRNDILETLNRCGILGQVHTSRDVEQTILIPAQYDVRFYREFSPRKYYAKCLPRDKARYTHVPEDGDYFYPIVRSVTTAPFKGTLRNLHVSHGNSFTIRGTATHNCEAAAVGLPVIAPRTTVHPEVIPDRFGNFFDADGSAPWPGAGAVSPWFEGIPFPVYGHNSKHQIINLMKAIRKNYTGATEKSAKFSTYVRSRMTWGISARLISDRIKALGLG